MDIVLSVLGFCFLLMVINVLYFATIYPHLEFVILETLSSKDKMEARELRRILWTQHRYWLSLAQFYQLMARLENERLVLGWYEPHKEYPEIKVRWYKLLEKGCRKQEVSLATRLWFGIKGLIPNTA